MKHRTLRCAAETLVLLLIAAMTVFLAAGLHQHAPDGALSTLSTGWYQLTDGVRREVTLPAALETGPGQTITLYNDTLTDSDGGKVLSARGVEYGIEIRAGETLLYRYEDNAFPKNAQMKGRLWADTELPYGLGGQTLSLTFTELPGRMCRIDAPVLGSMPAVTGRHIQSSLFSAGMILVMLVLAVLALLIFLYMSFYGIRERRFLDTAVFLLLCSLWCLTDSGLYQLYGADTAAGSVVSFYAFMTMAIPMVHFVRNTVSGRLRLVPDVCIALLCVNALAQGAAYRLFGVPFIDMLPLTHLLLTAGVAAMLTVLFRSYRAQPAPQLRLRMAAFAALGAFGVAALVLYWLLHIYWYDAVYQFGVLLFIILLLHGLISQAAEDMRFHMEHRISHEMQREDRMTGLPNRLLYLIIYRASLPAVPRSFLLRQTAALPLPDERGLADAGELDDLRVGMVIEQRHCVVELLGVELGWTALTEIRVGRARDRLALLRALDDHVALELRERQQHVAQQRVDRVVGQDAEIQYVDGHALVDHLGDESGRLRHRPRQPVELGDDEHIAFSQLRPQPVELRALDLRAGEGVRIDFFRARRRQRRLLRVQTVAVARLRLGRDSRVAECHVNSPVFPVLTPRVLNIGFDTSIITYDAEFCNRWQYLKVLRQTRIISSNDTQIFLYRLQQPQPVMQNDMLERRGAAERYH